MVDDDPDVTREELLPSDVQAQLVAVLWPLAASREPASIREAGDAKVNLNGSKHVVDSEIVATDFFTADVWGRLGKRTVYVLFAIHLATRRVHLVGVTEKPDEAFMKQTARNDTMGGVGWLKDVGAKYLVHDRDTKFTASWKELLKGSGVETLALPANSPDLNAYAERWVRSIKTECIRRLNFLGVGGLRRGVREYLEHYNAERPHQALGNFPLGPEPPAQKVDEAPPRGPIKCRESCGGVLKHYYRAAA